MCFSVGGGGGGNSDTYWSNIFNDQRTEANIRADQAQARADAEKAAAKAKFDTDLAAAVSGAPAKASAYLSRRGLPDDPNTMQQIIDTIKNKIPDLDKNPAQYFDDTAFATGIGTYENEARQKYGNVVSNTFKPGFERTLLPDASIDPYVASILNMQQGTAQQQLDFNRKRGLLNDTGYSAAQSELNNQAGAGRSTLSDIANSVLGKQRQGLNDIRGAAGDAASSYNYGADAPDISGLYTQATDLASRDLSNLEGSIRGAVGNTNFFDIPTALQKGGTMQGPINLTTNTASGAPAFDPNKKNTARGLGGGSIF